MKHYVIIAEIPKSGKCYMSVWPSGDGVSADWTSFLRCAARFRKPMAETLAAKLHSDGFTVTSWGTVKHAPSTIRIRAVRPTRKP